MADRGRIFLLRQGLEPRGIIGSGTVVTPPFEAEHWDLSRTTPARYVNVKFDALIDPETDPILLRKQLDEPPFADMYWDTQMSGTAIPTHVVEALEQEWAVLLDGSAAPPLGVSEPPRLYEGTSRAVTLYI